MKVKYLLEEYRPDETYRLLTLEIDVAKANQLIQKYPNQFKVLIASKDWIKQMLNLNRTYPEKIAKVDTSYPGIALEFPYNGGYILIDGNHRAARCLQDDKEFKVKVFTWEQAKKFGIILTRKVAQRLERDLAKKAS